VHWRAVVRSNLGNRVDHGNNMVAFKYVKDSEHVFALDREARDRPAVDDGLTSLIVDDARQERRTMAPGRTNAATIPEVGGDCLKPGCSRVIVERRMAGGGKK